MMRTSMHRAQRVIADAFKLEKFRVRLGPSPINVRTLNYVNSFFPLTLIYNSDNVNWLIAYICIINLQYRKDKVASNKRYDEQRNATRVSLSDHHTR